MLNHRLSHLATTTTLSAIFAAVLTACGGGTTDTGTWTTVALEGSGFSTTGTQLARFGVDSRWTMKTVSGAAQCTDAYFDGDPAAGSVKYCQLRGAATDAATPAPAPAPAPSPAPSASPTPPPAPAPVPTPDIPAPAPSPSPASPSPVAPAPAPAPAPAAPAPAPAPSGAPAAGGPVINVAKLAATALGVGTFNVTTTTEIAPDGGGAFRIVCGVARMAFDDPVVYPGQPGRSHLHTFFGNTGINANTTAESLRTTGNSTCRGGIANRSSYWVPTMIDTKDGTPLVPDDILVYYKEGAFDPAIIKPMPAGLRIIAGDASASTQNFKVFTMRFKCLGGPNNENDQYLATIGNCDVGAQLWSEIFFPQCWDGVNLDSPDHKSHMAYPNAFWDGTKAIYSCPSTHPVPLPQISYNVVYTVTEKDAGLRWRLSSDTYDKSLPGGYSSHGDWFNGWVGDISDTWAKKCINAKKDCHAHLLGDGRAIF